MPFPATFVGVRRLLATEVKPNQHIKTKVVDGVLVITLDTPGSKVNSLGNEIMQEFEAVMNSFETNSAVNSAVLISGKPGCFGKDIFLLSHSLASFN